MTGAPLLTYPAVRRYLLDLGATHTRTVGSHEQWKLPNGHRVTVPVADGETGRKNWGSRWRALNRWKELQKALARGPGHRTWGRFENNG